MLFPILNDDEFQLVCSFIDSTDQNYVNEKIQDIKERLLNMAKTDKQRKEIEAIPFYYPGKGLTIGNVCSQILSIFYLSRIDFYIIHHLKSKYMIRYCDDIIIFHPSKEYLQFVLKMIRKELIKYKLEINQKKSFIVNSRSGFVFCGNYVRIDKNKTIIHKCQSSRQKIRRRLKKKNKLYWNKKISFRHYFNSVNSYGNFDNFT